MNEKGADVSLSSVFDMWKNWQNGIMPVIGGWLDQPLNLLIQIKAIDLVITTFRCKIKKDFDWSNFDLLQTELIRWLKA